MKKLLLIFTCVVLGPFGLFFLNRIIALCWILFIVSFTAFIYPFGIEETVWIPITVGWLMAPVGAWEIIKKPKTDTVGTMIVATILIILIAWSSLFNIKPRYETRDINIQLLHKWDSTFGD
jgi:hypothetical protein